MVGGWSSCAVSGMRLRRWIRRPGSLTKESDSYSAAPTHSQTCSAGVGSATYAASRLRSQRSSSASMTIGDPYSVGQVLRLPMLHRLMQMAAQHWLESLNRFSREDLVERSGSLLAPGQFEEP